MRLDRSGIVKNIPYKEAKIATPPNPREILYINQQCKNLESSLAVAVLENINVSDICDLEELHQTMLEYPSLIYRMANLPHLHNIAMAYIFLSGECLECLPKEEAHFQVQC